MGCNLNPKIKMKFEPVIIKKVTDSLFTNVKSRIELLVDSLNKELSAEQKKVIEAELGVLREDSLWLDDQYSLFKTGKIRIDRIFAPGSLGLEQFQDSTVQNFGLPVDLNNDTSTFYFSYHGFVDTLQLYYHRSIVQNLEGARMRLNDIGINENMNTFDSLRLGCGNKQCSNDNTTIYIYF